MVRSTPDDELLVVIQIFAVQGDDEEAKRKEREKIEAYLINALSAPELRVSSLFLQESSAITDAIVQEPPAVLKLLFGPGRLHLPLLGLKFEIGPLSFFQSNTVTCAHLFERAVEWLRPQNSVLLDVCCGVGTIGLCMARHCPKVIGVELIEEAVVSARKNAALNNVENCEYRCGKAEDLMPKIIEELRETNPDQEVVAVVDPPRPGLHKTVLRALHECKQLTRIVYISCNPESLATDVALLTTPQCTEDEDRFVPLRAVPVDMFPHTFHCEMIVLLERASSKAVQERREAASKVPEKGTESEAYLDKEFKTDPVTNSS